MTAEVKLACGLDCHILTSAACGLVLREAWIPKSDPLRPLRRWEGNHDWGPRIAGTGRSLEFSCGAVYMFFIPGRANLPKRPFGLVGDDVQTFMS